MILVTGAGGKTGRALLRQLVQKGQHCRALVRRDQQREALLEMGASQAIVADLLDHDALASALIGVSAVYHIPPNIHPQEEEIGEGVIQQSIHAGVRHFIYHSVLRPYIRAMPHHLHKAHVEERLFTSGLQFTVLQPAAYMQNTVVGITTTREQGRYLVPYPVDTPFTMVDLDEVAEAGARIINNQDHFGATYELSGGEVLTPETIAASMAEWLGSSVKAEEVDLETWGVDATARGMSPYQVETLLKMFRYYAAYGFCGNGHTLTTLLGRPPKTYSTFLDGQDLPPLD